MAGRFRGSETVAVLRNPAAPQRGSPAGASRRRQAK